MCVQYIHNDEEYEKAVELIDQIWASEEGSSDFNRFEILTELIDAYERKRWPMDFPDPIEALKFHMNQKSLNSNDLGKILESTQLANDILNRRIHLSLAMVWEICKAWAIPAESLIKPYNTYSV
jgi:HTH-type transcriptional regulator/antitoxin HigA